MKRLLKCKEKIIPRNYLINKLKAINFVNICPISFGTYFREQILLLVIQSILIWTAIWIIRWRSHKTTTSSILIKKSVIKTKRNPVNGKGWFDISVSPKRFQVGMSNDSFNGISAEPKLLTPTHVRLEMYVH